MLACRHLSLFFRVQPAGQDGKNLILIYLTWYSSSSLRFMCLLLLQCTRYHYEFNPLESKQSAISRLFVTKKNFHEWASEIFFNLHVSCRLLVRTTEPKYFKVWRYLTNFKITGLTHIKLYLMKNVLRHVNNL